MLAALTAHTAAYWGAKVDAVVGFTNSDLVRFQTNDFTISVLRSQTSRYDQCS